MHSVPTQDPLQLRPHECSIPLPGASLYCREIGTGKPIMILHGGPDFNHAYLLPEMDRLADSFRLVYYDQRGRGRSAARVRPEDVSLETEMADMEGIRRFLRLESIALLGHSWGGVLAMEYAVRHPGRVSHLILMNTAPASQNDYLLFRERRRQTVPDDLRRLAAIAATDSYRDGDVDADAAYYRVHFNATLPQAERRERVVRSLRTDFTKEGIRKARDIEDRLMQETWHSAGYNLLPALARLSTPALIIHGKDDLVPVECAAHISQVLPHARFVVLEQAGHFAFIDAPDAVHQEIERFFRETERTSGTRIVQ